MNQMEALYRKVAGDVDLQRNFSALLASLEEGTAQEAEEKLAGFAKEAGYEISLPELKDYLSELAGKRKNEELSDLEMDRVAGGKSTDGIINIVLTVVTLGTDCAALSIIFALGEGGETCEGMFE